jgi:hypothetical protein
VDDEADSLAPIGYLDSNARVAVTR